MTSHTVVLLRVSGKANIWQLASCTLEIGIEALIKFIIFIGIPYCCRIFRKFLSKSVKFIISFLCHSLHWSMKFENEHLVATALSSPIKSLLLYSQAYITQTEHIPLVMMTNVGSTKFVNFMTPGTWVVAQGHGHIGDIIKKNH